MGRQAPPISEDRLRERELKRLGTEQVRTYRNVSRHDVYGHAPGDVMELTLTDGQHNALVEGSVLVEVIAEDVPEDADAALLADKATTGEDATVVKQEAAEEISADEINEGEQE